MKAFISLNWSHLLASAVFKRFDWLKRKRVW